MIRDYYLGIAAKAMRRASARPRGRFICLWAAPLWGAVFSLSAATPPLQYNRDIRPILAENCFSCHGPDSASRKADLRVDRREVALEMKAIVPGKPDESELVKRIMSADDDAMMPPPASHKKLSAADKKLLTDWIAAGAE